MEEIKWKFLQSINRKLEKIEKKKKYDSNSYNIVPNNFYKKINNTDCDIVNLHWIGNNLIPIKDLKRINKPIVWTLHDMWPYTGSEHYTKSLRFVEGYNNLIADELTLVKIFIIISVKIFLLKFE